MNNYSILAYKEYYLNHHFLNILLSIFPMECLNWLILISKYFIPYYFDDILLLFMFPNEFLLDWDSLTSMIFPKLYTLA